MNIKEDIPENIEEEYTAFEKPLSVEEQLEIRRAFHVGIHISSHPQVDVTP